MMVTVDKPRQDYLAPGADHGDIGMTRRELGERADFGNDAVALHDRAVIDLVPITTIGRFSKDSTAADDARGHVAAP
jgi:hypothetical protein